MRAMMNNGINYLHYIVECASVIAISCIVIAALSAGIYETPVILGGIGAIAGIAAWDIKQRKGN